MGAWAGEIFGVLTLATVLIAAAAKTREPDAFGLAIMLLISWALTNVTDALWAAPASKAFNPITDLTIGLMAVTAGVTRPRVWKMTLAFLFGLQMVAHVIYQGWAGHLTPWRLTTYDYDVWLNTTFALQLLCVGWPGLRDVVRHFSDLRRVPMGRHLGGGQAWP